MVKTFSGYEKILLQNHKLLDKYIMVENMMIFYKNDPKYNILFTSRNLHYLPVGIVKIRNDNKNTKPRILEILIKLIKSAVKPDYERGYRGILPQFQCHTM